MVSNPEDVCTPCVCVRVCVLGGRDGWVEWMHASVLWLLSSAGINSCRAWQCCRGKSRVRSLQDFDRP